MDGPVGIASPPSTWTLDAAYAYATQCAVAPSDPDGEPLYNCPFPPCSKQFSKRFNLKAHLRVHTGDKPFACPFPGCTRRFMWKSSLTSHQAGHSRRKNEMQKRNAVMAGKALAAESVQKTSNLPVRKSAYPYPTSFQRRLPVAQQQNVLSKPIHTRQYSQHQQHQQNYRDQQQHPQQRQQHQQQQQYPVSLNHPNDPNRQPSQQQSQLQHQNLQNPHHVSYSQGSSPAQHPHLTYANVDRSLEAHRPQDNGQIPPPHHQASRPAPPTSLCQQSSPDPSSMSYITVECPQNARNDPPSSLPAHSHSQLQTQLSRRVPRPPPSQHPSRPGVFNSPLQPQRHSNLQQQAQPLQTQSQPQQHPQPPQQPPSHPQAFQQNSQEMQIHAQPSRPLHPVSTVQQQFPTANEKEYGHLSQQSQSFPSRPQLSRSIQAATPQLQKSQTTPHRPQSLHSLHLQSQPMPSHSQSLHSQLPNSQSQSFSQPGAPHREPEQKSSIESRPIGQEQSSTLPFPEHPTAEKAGLHNLGGDKERVSRSQSDHEKLVEEQRQQLQRQEEQIKEQQRIIRQQEEQKQVQERQLMQLQKEREERSQQEMEEKQRHLSQSAMEDVKPTGFAEQKSVRCARSGKEQGDVQMTLPKLEDSSQRFQQRSIPSLPSPLHTGAVQGSIGHDSDRIGKRDGSGALPKAQTTLMSPASFGLPSSSILPSPSASLGLSRSPNGFSQRFLFLSGGASPTWGTSPAVPSMQSMMIASPKPPQTPNSHMDIQMTNPGSEQHAGDLSPGPSEIAVSPGIVTSPVPPPILPNVSTSYRSRRGLNRSKPPLGGPILSSGSSNILPPLTSVTPANPPTHIDLKLGEDDGPSCSLPALGSPHTELSPLPVASPIFGNGQTPVSPIQPYSPFSGLNSVSAKGKQGTTW